MRLERCSFLPLNLIKKMHVYDKIFVSMPTCMIEIENREDDGDFFPIFEDGMACEIGDCF